MYQVKEQDKTPEEQLTEVEIGNLSEKEFRVMIVKRIQDIEKDWRHRLRRLIGKVSNAGRDWGRRRRG